jgi:hypothetical protein
MSSNQEKKEEYDYGWKWHRSTISYIFHCVIYLQFLCIQIEVCVVYMEFTHKNSVLCMEYMFSFFEYMCYLYHVETYVFNSLTRGHEIFLHENFSLGVGEKPTSMI